MKNYLAKSVKGGTLCLALLLVGGKLIFAAGLPNFIEIIKTEKSKVVHITTTLSASDNPHTNDPFFKFFSPDGKGSEKSSGSGSGFFYDNSGLIITNNHVVKNATHIEVILSDNRRFEAKLIGVDERTDLALLKIGSKDEKFSAVKFGDSDKVQVGQWVLAIGNPLGLDQTATVGIISAKGRDILSGAAYGQFLQTDAAITFGNSGGPLFNELGEVIGINTAIVGNRQGLGFAIPSSLALNIIKQLKTGKEVVRGWLGVSIQKLTPELVEPLKLKNGQSGVILTEIFPNSPAKKAGLQESDIVITFNKIAIKDTNDLQLAVAETIPNTKVRLTIIRKGKQMRMSVVIGKFDENDLKIAKRSSESGLGLDLATVNHGVKAKYNLQVDKGVLVISISPDSPFKADLQAGDVILKINNTIIHKVGQFEDEVAKIKAKISFVLLINSNGNQRVISAKLE
ncbi:MAG: trypsin-like peptidase domain-containing protein [SAR324 cluster bacterium]|nr:trypsin-like peptidase domain-containing protein [SAR324 cluster bacterium]